MAGIHKLLVRIANREDPDQTASFEMKQSDLGLTCLSMPFWQATNVQTFRTFTVPGLKGSIRTSALWHILFTTSTPSALFTFTATDFLPLARVSCENRAPA